VELKVRGRSKYLSKPLTKKAITFYAEKLMTPRLIESLTIDILYVPHIELGDSVGQCTPIYDQFVPKDFEIYIANDITKKNTLLSLAHEMVHVKQYARGELYEYARKPHLSRWKDKIWEDFERQGDEYWFLPWEIEAHGYEKGLATVFSRHMYRQGTPLFKTTK